jgi:hypothetical protein
MGNRKGGCWLNLPKGKVVSERVRNQKKRKMLGINGCAKREAVQPKEMAFMKSDCRSK